MWYVRQELILVIKIGIKKNFHLSQATKVGRFYDKLVSLNLLSLANLLLLHPVIVERQKHFYVFSRVCSWHVCILGKRVWTGGGKVYTLIGQTHALRVTGLIPPDRSVQISSLEKLTLPRENYYEPWQQHRPRWGMPTDTLSAPTS